MKFRQASVFGLEYLHAFVCGSYRCYGGLQSSGVMGSVVDALCSFPGTPALQARKRLVPSGPELCIDGTQGAKGGRGRRSGFKPAVCCLEMERRTSVSAPRGCSLSSAPAPYRAGFGCQRMCVCSVLWGRLIWLLFPETTKRSFVPWTVPRSPLRVPGISGILGAAEAGSWLAAQGLGTKQALDLCT